MGFEGALKAAARNVNSLVNSLTTAGICAQEGDLRRKTFGKS